MADDANRDTKLGADRKAADQEASQGASQDSNQAASQAGATSLQDRYAPKSVCFGCGPANDDGLRIKSFVDGDEVVATFQPQTCHEAFPGVLSGGIIGTLLDCHCNWTAAHHLMARAGEDHIPSCVTAEYTVTMRRPTPTDGSVMLKARVVSATDRTADVEGTLQAGGKVTATCRGSFVTVGPGHPAYGRWDD